MKRTMVVAGLSWLALVACGGGQKQADSPGTCPEGTVLKGEDCVPPGDDSPPPSSSGSSSAARQDEEAKQEKAMSSGGESTPAPSGSKTPYDEDAIEVQLKRSARSVKASCGSATDDEGKATGPWGTTKVTVTLGRNGHVRQATIPAPYDGKPAGKCTTNAFLKIQFPPYAAGADSVIEWDVEIVEPKH